MGYSTDLWGRQSYWPDNSDNKLYIASPLGCNPHELVRMCQQHFGDSVDMDKLEITAETLHTQNLSYDIYDPGDYTNFLVITRVE